MTTVEAWKARGPKLARSFEAVRRRAHERAVSAGRARVDVAHLVAALLEEEQVRAAIDAIGADLEEVEAVVEGTADETPPKRWWHFGGPRESRALASIYERAMTHAFGAELEEVTPLNLFVRALQQEPTSTLTGRLDAFEIEPLPLMRFDAHGRVDDPPLEDGEGPARVVILNDPYTTMEAVVEILGTYLDLEPEAAERIMRKVHERGRSGVRFASWAEAKRRAEQAREDARLRGFPLELRVRAR